jgi:hypothetical protein
MSSETTPGIDQRLLILLTWIWVGVPFGYGIYQLMHKIHALFSS